MKKTREKPIKVLPLGLARWAEEPTKFSRKEFAIEVLSALREINGEGTVYDLNTVTILADQMETYVKMSEAVQNETPTIMNSNGSTGINPIFKIRDMALMRVLTINKELNLFPSGKGSKKHEHNDIADLLEGPQL